MLTRRVFARRRGMILAGLALIVGASFLITILTPPAGDGGSDNTRSFGATVVYAAGVADRGEAIFEGTCIACHTIGSGRLVGPDLLAVAERRDGDWLIRAISSPDKLITEGDPIAKQLVEEYGTSMPNLGLSIQDAEDVLSYIEAKGMQTSVPSGDQGAGEALAPGDASVGRAIFTGQTRLSNGGAACLSCHNVDGLGGLGGGALAKDLTDVYSRFGPQALASVLSSVPFPMMAEVFSEHPLTEDEIGHLVAFLEETSAAGEGSSSNNLWALIGSGIGGLIVVAIIFRSIWKRRLAGVRQQLIRGGPETISEKRRITYTAIAVAVVSVVTGLIVASAMFSGGPAPYTAETSPSNDGGELFADNCAVCHGQNREGITNLGPELTGQSLTKLSDTEILDTISDGRPAKGMPAWQGTLSGAEIDALVQFVRSATP